jgi:DnaJ-class molecular chaperone
MSNQIQPLPPAGCGICGRAALSTQQIGTRCANPLQGGPCEGHYRATLAPTDWLLCAGCHGSGAIGSQLCAQCEGSGWRYARPQFP